MDISYQDSSPQSLIENKEQPKKTINFFFVIAIFLFVTFGACTYYFSSIKQNFSKDQTFYIPPGYSSEQIAQKLEADKIVNSRHLLLATSFVYRLAKGGRVGSLKAGEYLLPQKASVLDIVKLVASGKIYLRKFTVVEGQSVAQVVQMLRSNPTFSGEIVSIPAEGTILPDTYQYKYGDKKQDILYRMQRALSDFMEQNWPLRSEKEYLKSPQDAIILASVVEKETGIGAERALIAGVFFNRLRLGMRLQSDPTVIYGMTLGMRDLGRPLNREDLKNDTLHNTYTREGLPPSPIACPGKSAILAVLHPESTDKVYFVANGQGGHSFSENLSKHNHNVKTWKKIKDSNQKLDN